ncbi:hypothetical protein BV22DRAFT_1049691 [Leucogyrophana mollusca]|uniref:Uncharacterized protein n=1 Tax=Leucogyrophana mollusca TaxID=85980 RepID=A0ACB8B742_9AGAM|nr:hypothetical protein BV22DRAFT_1049691 [Leucogyrophana mollusca]
MNGTPAPARRKTTPKPQGKGIRGKRLVLAFDIDECAMDVDRPSGVAARQTLLVTPPGGPSDHVQVGSTQSSVLLALKWASQTCDGCGDFGDLLQCECGSQICYSRSEWRVGCVDVEVANSAQPFKCPQTRSYALTYLVQSTKLLPLAFLTVAYEQPRDLYSRELLSVQWRTEFAGMPKRFCEAEVYMHQTGKARALKSAGAFLKSNALANVLVLLDTHSNHDTGMLSCSPCLQGGYFVAPVHEVLQLNLGSQWAHRKLRALLGAANQLKIATTTYVS